MSYIRPLHLCTLPARCRCWRTSRGRQVLNGAVAAIIAARLNYICLHKPFSAWKSNSLSGTPLCYIIGFHRQQSTKILHQIEIATVCKNDTYAHKMIDSRKSDHRMGGILGLS